MGKLSYDPCIQHFSHEHILELSNFQQQPLLNLVPSSCSGCKLKPKPSELIYTCKLCNYILHISCSQMPKLINHPADPKHSLTLLPYPAYPEGLFNCDACGQQGNGFSYHCSPCSLDVHIHCATMPLSLNHTAHPHPLLLVFCSPYETKGFSCDICHKFGLNHWLYRCNSCEFDAHVGCATAQPISPATIQVQQSHMQAKPIAPATNQVQESHMQQLLQHHNSFPSANHPPQLQTQRSAHLGNVDQQPNYYVSSPSTGIVRTVRPVQYNTPRNNLMNVAINGLVDGFTQQIGQSLVQSIMGGGNSGGSSNGTGGSGGDSSSSVLDFGSSVLGNMFGNSDSSNY